MHKLLLFAIFISSHGEAFCFNYPVFRNSANTKFSRSGTTIFTTDFTCSLVKTRQCRPAISILHCQAKDNVQVSKGFNILELTGSLVPQGYLVKIVKTGMYLLLFYMRSLIQGLGWSTFWKIFMQELAPQDRYFVEPFRSVHNKPFVSSL